MSSITYGAVTNAARMLARKTRSQVRVPPPPQLHVRQVTVQSIATGQGAGKTASVLLAGSATAFDVSYSPHYVPVAGDTCWVMFIGTTALALAKCQ